MGKKRLRKQNRKKYCRDFDWEDWKSREISGGYDPRYPQEEDR